MLDATPLLNVYARVRLHQLRGRNVWAVQQRQLLRLVARAKGTRFGRDHGFATIRSVRAFQERVPLRTYVACGKARHLCRLDETARTAG